jgi:hypothetical protein
MMLRNLSCLVKTACEFLVTIQHARPALLLSLLLLLVSSAPGYVWAQEVGITKPLQKLVGEDYLYAIDFLFFTKLAEGELRLSETDQPNVYRAELVGRTLGVASWLTGDRTQTYTSLMELVPDGSLRSIEHVATITKRKWGKWQNRARYYRYDYEQGKVFDEKTREGVFHSKKEHDIPDGQQPVDMLTAFYNLRAGTYGPLVRGARFLISTYAKGEFPKLEINVLTLEQQAEHGYFPPHGLLVQVKVDPEVFETGSGKLYIWFNDAGILERGIIEDLIGFGDIRGYLNEEDL